MKYKVAVISSLYPPYSRGGAERTAEAVAQGLKEEGHKIFVITAETWRGIFSLIPKVLESGDVKTYRFYPFNLFSFASIGKYPLFLRLIWRVFDTFNLHSFAVLWFILKRERPDIVWTHNLTGIGLLAPLLLKILKIPHIHTLHDVSLVEPSGIIAKERENRGLIIRLIWSAVSRKLFGAPALVVSPSKWLLDFYLKHNFFKNSKKLIKQNPVLSPVIPTPPTAGEESRPPATLCARPLRYAKHFGQVALRAGGNPDFHRGDPRTSRVSPWLPAGFFPRQRRGQNDKIDESKKIIQLLYIGQLEKQKGILFLISALDELSAKYNFNLFIAGGGKLFGLLKKIAAKKAWLVLCGKLDGEDLAKIREKTDLAVVPSLIFENSPTVIYESLVNGVPVIASRIGGIPELVRDGINGLLFEAGDKEDLKKKLADIFKNPQILDNLRQGALTFEAKTPIIYVRDILALIYE